MVSHLGLMAEAELNPAPRPAIGNHIFGTFGHDLPTKDRRRVMVTALTKRQWQSLMTVTDIGDDIATLEQKTGLDLNQEGSRYQCRAQIVDALNKWSITKNLDEIATFI